MNTKEIISNFNIKPKNINTVSNIKQNGLIATFNKKTIKIVVAARQYRGGTILSRGYGDVASGVRGLSYLRKIYPTAKFSFVFEHFADSKEEFLKLKVITSIFDVKTYILNGRIKDDAQFQSQQWQQEHQENEVNQLLQEADFVFHDPAGLISPLKDSNGEYAKKTVGVSEYERNTGFYSKDNPHGIANFNMGLNYNRIYLCEPILHKNQFQDNILSKYCRNPILNNKVIDGKNNFYFHYDHNVLSLVQMVRIIILIEGDCSKNIVLVSTNNIYIKTFQQAGFKKLLLKYCPYQAVKVCGVNNDGEYVERIIYENPQGHHVKNIHLITPAKLNNNDFKLLQKGSVINYSTGDISTSDVLAMSKLPVFGIYNKKCLYLALLDKIKAFCMIEGNEQYQVFIDVWMLAASNFTREAKDRLPKKSPLEIKSLQKLRSLKWKVFELKFTDWLKENNQTESFIRDKAEEIIAKST